MNSGDISTITILTVKELLDEQILLEQGRYRLRLYWQRATNAILARALTRKSKDGWKLLAVESKALAFGGSNYILGNRTITCRIQATVLESVDP